MAKKLPAFQFYPGDWRKDPGVQSLDYFDRGVWFEMLCLMHESDERGKLMLNGQPMAIDALARLLGLDKKKANNAIANLSVAGVVSIDEGGAFYSRRMVRDEEVRNQRAEGGVKGAEHGAKGAEFGKLGGRPKKEKGGDEYPPLKPPLDESEIPPIKPPPSFSFSVSSSEEGNTGTNVPPAVAPPAADPEKELKAEYRAVTDKSQQNVAAFIRANKPLFIEPYADIWNIFAMKYGKPAIRELNSTRQKKFKSRIREEKFDFLGVLNKARQSKLLMEKSWFNFDFICCNDSKYLKILEGHYDDDRKIEEEGKTIIKQDFNGKKVYE